MGGQDKSANSDRDRNGSEPHSIHSIEGHSTVDVATGELLWEPEEVRLETDYNTAYSVRFAAAMELLELCKS